MLRILVAMALGIVPVLAQPAAAVENWTIYDLGASRKESICLAAASAAFTEFGNIHGIERVAAGNWVVFAWGLSRGDHDAVITCTNAAGAGARGTLVIYSEHSSQARFMAQSILASFDAQNAALQEDFINRALRENGF